MTLTYRFKKEKLEGGGYAPRPKILVTLNNNGRSIDITALIDSGCDVTVIPKGIAKYLNLNLKGKKTKLYGYKEATNVVESKVNIVFIGKAERQSVKLSNVPVLVPTKDEDDDVILGVRKIFDEFNITFKKSENKIILKKAGYKVIY